MIQLLQQCSGRTGSMPVRAIALILAATLIAAVPGFPKSAKGKKKKPSAQEEQLAAYTQSVLQAGVPKAASVGSLWQPDGPFSNLAADFRARNVNDLITIRIVEQTSANAAGTVKSARSFDTSSGISGLLGQVGPRSGLQTILSAHSNRTLDGQAQTSSVSDLQTSLGGHIVQVLPNGAFVVQAEREIEMNNERQSVVVRGLIRPGDIAPDNSVLSTQVSNLEVVLKGKGVISEGVRPPNPVVRAILRIIGF